MNRAELIANMEATAAKLAGRDVIVRIKRNPGALGLVQKDLAGRAVMDLDPALFEPGNVREFTDTFTHEAAHLLRHFGSMPRRDIEQDTSQEIRRQAAHVASMRGNPIVAKQEDEADSLAADWRKAVDRHYLSYVQACNDPILAVLHALYHHGTGRK